MTWLCRRQRDGRKCGHRNDGMKQKCVVCGGPRPARRKPGHMQALLLPYETYIEISGGDRCCICLRERTEGDRKFDRDHDHLTKQPRGLLCFKCNMALPRWMTPEWLDAAAEYLRRAA